LRPKGCVQRALAAPCAVCRCVPRGGAGGVTTAMAARPSSESRSSMVRVESRYGRCVSLRGARRRRGRLARRGGAGRLAAGGERCASSLHGAEERCASGLYGAEERCASSLYGAEERCASSLYGDGEAGRTPPREALDDAAKHLPGACASRGDGASGAERHCAQWRPRPSLSPY
jgi:hypothetical protein